MAYAVAMASTSATRDEAYVARVSDRVAEQVRKRVTELREQGRGLADLGAAEDVAAPMVATLPQPSPWPDLGPFYSTKGIARVLGGVSRQAVDDRRRRRTLFALRTSDWACVNHWTKLAEGHPLLPSL